MSGLGWRTISLVAIEGWHIRCGTRVNIGYAEGLRADPSLRCLRDRRARWSPAITLRLLPPVYEAADFRRSAVKALKSAFGRLEPFAYHVAKGKIEFNRDRSDR